MHGRIIVISDLHLGRPRHAARSADALRPLWQDAAHLIVNGDAAEVHHPSHWSQAARETIRLFDLCEEDGVELTILSGNHDPYISDLKHLHVADDAVFITHGDVLHPAVAPWSPASGRIREAHEKALAALTPEDRHDLASRLSACQHASYAEWQNVKELQEAFEKQAFTAKMQAEDLKILKTAAVERDLYKTRSENLQKEVRSLNVRIINLLKKLAATDAGADPGKAPATKPARR